VQGLAWDLDHLAGGAGNMAFVDLETGAIRKVEAANTDSEVEQPGEDICLAIDLAASPSPVGLLGRNGARVFPCDVPGQALADLRRIDPTRLGTSADNVFGPTIAIQTAEGNFAFLRIDSLASGSYVISRDPLVQPSGTADCP
jgi:hypothetical protein